MAQKIFLTVKPAAKQDRVEKTDETHYKVWVKAPAAEGRANEAIVEVFARYLGVPKSRLTMIRGFKSKVKVIEIP